MATIQDVAAYFCQNYPHSHELSKTRLTKLVYLADWFSAEKHGCQITCINWYFDNYGPYVEDVINTIEQNKSVFQIDRVTNIYGSEKMLISINPETRLSFDSISRQDREILDDVIEKTRHLYWKPFLKFVYSTKPIAESDRYQALNLVHFAQHNRKSRTS